VDDGATPGGRQGSGLGHPPVVPEPELEEAFDRPVGEGCARLARSWLTLVIAGLLGGLPRQHMPMGTDPSVHIAEILPAGTTGQSKPSAT
jgi:hypothetical protein